METAQELSPLAETKQKTRVPQQVVTKAPGRYSFSAQAMAFENARYFWMSLLMTAQSCLGAVACMFILYSGGNIFALATCAAVTMGSNAMFIGLASPRLCLGVLYLSIALNIFFILSNPM